VDSLDGVPEPVASESPQTYLGLIGGSSEHLDGVVPVSESWAQETVHRQSPPPGLLSVTII